MDSKDTCAIVPEILAHMYKQEGRGLNYSNWYIGVASNIEQCRFRNHIAVSDEFAYIILRAVTERDAISVQEYIFGTFDVENNEEDRKQTGVYVYACIKKPENCKARSSQFAVKLINGAELLNYYKLGERNLSEVVLEKVKLKNTVLTDIDLSGAKISKANLINVNLRGAKLEYASLKNISFKNVDLNDANLGDAYVKKTKLEQVNLQRSCLSKIHFHCVSITDSDFTDANLEEMSVSLDNISLSKMSKLINCCLIRANLRSADLSGFLIQDSDLTEADLRQAEVRVTISEYCSHIIREEDWSSDWFDDMVSEFSRNNVILDKTIMPNGRVGSN